MRVPIGVCVTPGVFVDLMLFLHVYGFRRDKIDNVKQRSQHRIVVEML